MCDVIEHRGPDDSGFHLADGAAIGMRRLSIIDLATGHQPLCNEDGSLWIVFNGEIYNFQALRAELIARGHTFKTSSDTETIIHLYEDEGPRCVERLRGMFAFAIYDQRDGSLFLARDRVGKKPLHYAQPGDGLIFGSEIKSLLQHPAISREINLEAISDFLTFGYVPEPATAFRGIHKLLPGHTLTFRNGRLSTRRYWDFDFTSAIEPARDENYYVERLRELLAESVRLRLVSDVPLGAFLSGGIDSSTVVALMAREMNQPVKTFSIGFSEASHDELKFARLTARRFATEHHEFIVTPDVCRLVEEIVWHHDEPFADDSCIPTYVVSKLASDHVKVVLSGDGGDEVFAGYQLHVQEQRFDAYSRIPKFIRRGALLPLSRALPRAAYGKNFLRRISLDAGARYIDSLSFFTEDAQRSLWSAAARRSLDGYDPTAAYQKIYAAPEKADSIERMLYLDSRTYLPGDILTKVDRMSMAHSLETRAPLLDHKLIEFVATIPSAFKLRCMPHGLETKYILKKAISGLVPDEIIRRGKQGFGTPIQQWFRGELREMVGDVLNDQKTRGRGLFNQPEIAAVLDEHWRGRRDNSQQLWSLLMLELWQRHFIDQRPEPNFAGAKGLSLDHLAAVGA
jgi:asparagine synthase (glutamine-hydrolysing)